MIEYRLYAGPDREKALKRIRVLMKHRKMTLTKMVTVRECPRQNTMVVTRGNPKLWTWEPGRELTPTELATPKEMLLLVYQ